MAKRRKQLDIKTSPFISKMGAVRQVKQPIEQLGGDYEVVKKKYYQTKEYTKIIIDQELDLETYVSLSNLAKGILFYIFHILEYNSPTFELKIDTIVQLFKTSRRYGYKAIKELVEVKYIARSEIKQVYWINHNKFFKGNHTFELYAVGKEELNKNKLKTYETKDLFKESR